VTREREGVLVADTEVVRAFRAVQRRFHAGEVGTAAFAHVLADDVVWHVPGSSVIAGEHRGREAVMRYFALRRDVADATLRITVNAEMHVDDLVITKADGTAVLGGSNTVWQTVGIYRIADGRVAECWMVPLDQAAFDRAWVSPSERLLDDAVVRQRIVRCIPAAADTVDVALRDVTAGDMPAARLVFALRSLPEYVLGHSGLPTSAAVPFIDGMISAGLCWLLDRPGQELTFGLIGQPWRLTGGETVRVATIDEFAAFDRPGFAKIVERFRLLPAGDATVVVDELWVQFTDDASRRRFLRYWRVISPGSRLVRRQLLTAVARRTSHGVQADRSPL
jgi:ketosteroid isomerase-like protein